MGDMSPGFVAGFHWFSLISATEKVCAEHFGGEGCSDGLCWAGYCFMTGSAHGIPS